MDLLEQVHVLFRQEATIVFSAKPFVLPATCIVGDGLRGSNYTVAAVSGALSGVFHKLAEARVPFVTSQSVLAVTFSN